VGRVIKNLLPSQPNDDGRKVKGKLLENRTMTGVAKPRTKAQRDAARLVKSARVGGITRRVLVVKGKPDIHTHIPEDTRSVHLIERDSGGAESLELFDVDVPLQRVRSLVEWALAIGIPVECHPPECLSADYTWPAPGWVPVQVLTLPPISKGES
jgi:hypothetical protein